MKILHLTKKYLDVLGGDAIAVDNLVREQSKEGHEVYILTSNCDAIRNDENIFKFGLKVKPFDIDKITGKRLFSLLLLSKNSFKLLKEKKIDVVHCHNADLAYFSSRAAHRLGIPIINTCRGLRLRTGYYPFYMRASEKFFLRASKLDRIVSVDKGGVADLNNLGFNNVDYIPNGVNLNKFKGPLQKQESGEMEFLYVGRLEEEKGLKYLFEAVAILNKGGDIRFKVTIVGAGSQEEELRRIIKDKKISNINLKGKINYMDEELASTYGNADVFVLPSMWEGFPRSMLEAWAMGIPCIVTKVGGVPYICEHEKNALIVPPGNPIELAKAMLELAQDQLLQKKLGINGRKTVEDKYGAEIIAKEYLCLYDKLLSVKK